MAGEKTEKPTARKIREARKDGRVARSADFTAVFVVAVAGVTLYLVSDVIVSRLVELFATSLSSAARAPGGDEALGMLHAGLRTWFVTVLPVLVVAALAAAIVNYLQVGALFTVKPLLPDGERLNPAAGLKRMFGKDRGVDLVKNSVRLTVMIAIGSTVYAIYFPALVSATGRPASVGIELLSATARTTAVSLWSALALIGLFDLLVQRHRYTRDLKMSRSEVKQEFREAEGDPAMKSERRRLHQELLRGSGLSDVQHADVVVVNPTHVAVALQYRPEAMHAPRVIAKGRGEVAGTLRHLARRHRIPIIRNVRLARSLIELELDAEIPEDLFEAVAEVLHFVYSLEEEADALH